MLPPYQSCKRVKPKVVAGIPAYNEAESIGDIIRRALSHVDEVIVVDDGSTDNTAQVASAAGATVIRSEHNQGAGGATGVCFQQAREGEAAVLVTIDGDGQHNAAEMPSLIAPVLRGEADLVIGSRFLDKGCRIPRYRRFGITVISTLLNLASRVKVSDSQSCYRAYSKKALRSLDITEPGFAFSVELIIKARRQGLAIDEVPISCIYHDHSHSLNPVVHGIGVALSVIRLRANLKSWQ
jgi:glycosyltransferase involved in cell wall biosynthesis